MDIPFSIFILFIVVSSLIAVFGFMMRPRVPLFFVVSGILWISLFLLIDNIIVETKAQPVLVNSTLNPSFVNTVISNSNVNAILLNGTVTGASEFIGSVSSLNDIEINTISIRLSRGTTVPAGTATIGIFRGTGTEFTLLKSFGVLDVTTLSPNAQFITFTLSPGDIWLLRNPERIGIQYTLGTPTSFVRVHNDCTTLFDGTTAVSTYFATGTGWTAFPNNECDIALSLRFLKSVTAGYDIQEIFYNNEFQESNVLFPFTTEVKTFFLITAVSMMLIGALEQRYG